MERDRHNIVAREKMRFSRRDISIKNEDASGSKRYIIILRITA